MRRKRD